MRIPPLDRYPTGVLHPIDPGRSGIDPALAGTEEGEGALLDDPDDTAPSDAARGRSAGRPTGTPAPVRTAVIRGILVLRSGQCLPLHRAIRRRLPGSQPRAWRAGPIPITAVRAIRASGVRRFLDAVCRCKQRDQRSDLGRARQHRHARPASSRWPHRNGHPVEPRMNSTPALGVATEHATAWRILLFEARLECVIESGELVDYPRVDPSLLTEEEQELELQYRQQRIYAIGHGAAADWELQRGQPARIWSDFMPEAEVPLITVETRGEEGVLSLVRLAAAPIPDELEHFVDRYADWVAEQIRVASAFPNGEERATANRICGRMDSALKRMRACVEMLRTDPLAEEAFRLANRAMLDQMRQADRVARPSHRQLPLASVSVGIPAHDHAIRDPGTRPVSRGAGPDLVSHWWRQDRSLPWPDSVSHRMAPPEASLFGRRDVCLHALHLCDCLPASSSNVRRVWCARWN